MAAASAAFARERPGRGEGTAMSNPCLRRFFEAETERLLNRLYGTALRLARDPADAEDLVAEALAKAWAKIDQLQDRQAFEKWLFRILVNTFLSEKRRRHEEPAGDVAGEVEGADGFSLFAQLHQPFLLWWGNPEQDFLNKLLREDIEAALERLPEAYRIVVILVEIHGLSYDETAKTLEVPVGTVRSRLNRGRGLLQRALWRQAGQLGIATGGKEDGSNV
ncbi:MAG TPA: sigma-70 family RNA polymerase sigma factor [Afifellaceae bacterium]|nr:sigma-70 family RNA polymerase sigma factor [Afifellaceae bacterium]